MKKHKFPGLLVLVIIAAVVVTATQQLPSLNRPGSKDASFIGEINQTKALPVAVKDSPVKESKAKPASFSLAPSTIR